MTSEDTRAVGVCEWFPVGDHDHVESVLGDLAALRVRHLRTELSFSHYCAPGGRAWYEWLLPRLSAEVEVLPCFVNAPVLPAAQSPSAALPRAPAWYADFVDEIVTRLGAHFEWAELWCNPGDLRKWDVELDPEWWIFSQMVSGAAHRGRRGGKRIVLGSTGPVDPNWARLMCERNVMRSVDAVGIHGPILSHDTTFEGHAAVVAKVRDVLARYDSSAEIWVTGTGYSTSQHDERKQLSAFVDAVDAPVQRVYWHAARDVGTEPELARPEQHVGLTRRDGTRKLLFRLWEAGGPEAVRDAVVWGDRAQHHRRKRPALITGGAGFVGTNLAHRLLGSGGAVLILDDLSRPHAERNLHWLRQTHGSRAQLQIADVRDTAEVEAAVGRASLVFHLAAQTAVLRSVTTPALDFDVNVRGTLNILEALRKLEFAPPLVYTSTSKVYGGLDDVTLRCVGRRYEPADPVLRREGLAEDRPLDWSSPYVCSKAAADQYVLDYARTFGLSAVVFRMSSIYGPHQLGSEQQGWVARMLARALAGLPVTIQGDGMQVRDLLHVDDLVDALLLAQEHMRQLSGQAYNIGGGPQQALSELELLELIGALHGRLDLDFGPMRSGELRYYVANTRKFSSITGFSPSIDVSDGVEQLYHHLRAQHDGPCNGNTAKASALS